MRNVNKIVLLERCPESIGRADSLLVILITLNVVMHLMQWIFKQGQLFDWSVLSVQALAEGRFWTLLSSMFVHVDWLHLSSNMLILAWIVSALRGFCSTLQILLLYVAAGVGGGLLELLWNASQPGQSQMGVFGASAAILGVFIALLRFLPDVPLVDWIRNTRHLSQVSKSRSFLNTLCLWILPTALRGWHLILIVVTVSLALAVWDSLGQPMFGMQVAHFAHLGGALVGGLFAHLVVNREVQT